MSDVPKPRRRWFRFSLRTFFVLLTAFGVWLGVQVKWIRDRRAQMQHPYVVWLGEHRTSRHAPWSIRLFGEQAYGMIGLLVRDPSHLQADEARAVEQLRALFPESKIIVGQLANRPTH